MPNLFLFTDIKLPENLPGFARTIKNHLQNKKIVVVSPHSDDIAVSCGVTIKKLAKSNKITPLLFFSGFRGVENKTKEQAAKIREKEMIKEAKMLGIEKPIFLKLGSYETSLAEKKDVLKVKDFFTYLQPNIVFLPKTDDLQPRHYLATKIALRALALCGKQTKQFPELFFYENPWSLFRAFEFNVISIFGEKELKDNLKIIRAHRSQLDRTRFDRTALSLAQLRGAVVPEQRIFGYGKKTNHLKKFYIETFKYRAKYSEI